VTKQRDHLDCPACGTPLVSHDGLGAPDASTWQAWRDAVDHHQPTCSSPPPAPTPTDAAITPTALEDASGLRFRAHPPTGRPGRQP
jgi:hypothetical protein